MSEPDPRKHYEFDSYRGSLKLSLPFVIDEHENTGITVSAIKQNSDNSSFTTVQISTSGALVLQETANRQEVSQIKTKIVTGGNNSFHIQSPAKYEYPSGTEGECVAQVNILLRKLDEIEGEEVPSDSLSIDLYIRRKLLNVFKATWKSANGFLVNIGSSAIITSLVAIATFFGGENLASLVPHFFIVFIGSLILISLGYSWYTQDKLISKRLNCNSMYQELKRRQK